MTEYWSFGSSQPHEVSDTARAAEDDGWDGLVYVDSQNLRMDVFVVMATATGATSRLKVSPGVTNPVTRHPAVSASAIAAIHTVSGGRASYGIGRGDSALAYIGAAPCSVDIFERYVRHVQAYLSGERIPFAELGTPGKSVTTLELGDEPTDSWLRWLQGDLPKVTVEVVATGPKTIGVGGRHADMVTFTVGADSERLNWGIETARAAGRAVDRPDSDLRFGAYINVACHPDQETARTLVSGGLASFARFSAMHGAPTGPVSSDSGTVLRNIRDNYDMKHHGEPNSSQTDVLTDDFVDTFSVAGGPDHCIERLSAIVALGFDRIVVTPPNVLTRAQYPDETAKAERLLADEVLPHLPRGN